jgi:hypothetical protein
VEKIENNKTNKKRNIVLFAIILVILVLILRNTYSKYINTAAAVIKKDVAEWNIKVNDVDITEQVENSDDYIEFDVDNFTWDWDKTTHLKEPNVAPGMTGSFDITVDPTGTDVSIEYTIALDDEEIKNTIQNSLLKKKQKEGNTNITSIDDIEDIDDNKINLKVTKIEKDGVEVTDYKRDPDTNKLLIVVRKSLDEIKSEDENTRIDNIHVTIEWVNDEDNNDTDSLLGAYADGEINLPILIDFTQYVKANETNSEGNVVNP